MANEARGDLGDTGHSMLRDHAACQSEDRGVDGFMKL